MSRPSTPLPSHSFLILNRVTNWLAALFVFLLLITILIVYTLTYTIRRDCNNPYSRDMRIFGYWLSVDAGSMKTECPKPEFKP